LSGKAFVNVIVIVFGLPANAEPEAIPDLIEGIPKAKLAVTAKLAVVVNDELIEFDANEAEVAQNDSEAHEALVAVNDLLANDELTDTKELEANEALVATNEALDQLALICSTCGAKLAEIDLLANDADVATNEAEAHEALTGTGAQEALID